MRQRLWQTSVAQLTEGGRRLLDRLAWLAPEKVPESLLDVPVPAQKPRTCATLTTISHPIH